MLDINIDLRAKQSVRTSFLLSAEEAELKNSLAERLDITQKELLDVMCDFFLDTDNETRKTAIRECAQAISDGGTRKTHVISRRAQQLIYNASIELELPRDRIVGNMIALFKAATDRRINVEYVQASQWINSFCTEAYALENNLIELLGSSDPVVSRFGTVHQIILNLSSAIDTEIGGGEPVDPDDFSQ